MNPYRPPGLRRFGVPWILPLALAVSVSSGRARTNDLSLAGSFPPETLRSILVAREAWRPFPAAADRPGWERLPLEVRQGLIRAGEDALAHPLPPLPATLYLGYAREGNRSRFEGPYFDRRRRLHRLVLAECAEGRHRFRDAIADTLWAICEESTWCVPAHVGGQKAGVGLPDTDEPILDLFAAQTGSSVAWTLYLAGADLDAVSPVLRRRAVTEVNRRVLTTYLERDYGWMGFGSRNPANRPNNWNPWINGNVLTTALLLEPAPDRRIALVHRVLDSLDRFLQPYPSDGGCDEGPGYWSRAGASVFDNLDLLASATGGRLEVFGHPLIGEMGRFIHRVHVAGDWYVDLGDCAARLGLERGVIFRYGERIGDSDLRDFGSSGATWEGLVAESGGIDLGRGLRTLVDLPAILARADRPPPLVRDAWLGSEDLEMMIARDRGGTTNGWYVAAWGGHNAQSHNHNDVGNVIVFADGQPVFVDLGAPTYTAKTFSSRRYEIPAMQSSWHNLPSINGVQQSAGRAFAAREVAYRADDAGAEWTGDIAPAWPASAGVRSWRRTVRLERGVEVRIVDDFQLDRVEPGAVSHWITPREPRIGGPGQLELPGPTPAAGSTAGSRGVYLLFDPERLEAVIEPFDVDDARLAGVWGPRLYRVKLSAKTPASKDTWVLRLRFER